MKESTYLRIEVQAISNDEMPCNVHLTFHSKHYFYSVYLFDLPSISQVENIFSQLHLSVEYDALLLYIPVKGYSYTLDAIINGIGAVTLDAKELDMFFVCSRPCGGIQRTDYENYLLSLLSKMQEKEFLKYPTRKPVKCADLPF